MTTSSQEQDQQPDTPQHSMIRVALLGTFEVTWEGQPFPPERLAGRGAAPALGLLKALLTQPDRFATRDWIMEQFWPESLHNRASERLDDVASHLRTLLRPSGSTAKILHYVYGANGKGSGYRLEGYPLIWVDADAFEWYVEQAARFERFGQDALSLWEQAYQLGSRGEFLPEERYSDWACERREVLAGHYRQCVHRLTTLLRERGATEQAILRLRAYWQTRQTDEDVLRPLMELLGEQERYQEAEQFYQQCMTALEEEGRVPDLRTQDMREVLRTKEIQRTRIVGTHLDMPFFAWTQPQNVQAQKEPLLPLSRIHSEQVGDSIVSLSPIQKNYSSFALSSFTHLNVAQDTLQTFEELLEGCWELNQGSNLKTAETLLWSYLPKVTEIEFSFPVYQQKAASLATQGYILAASLVGHHNGDLCSRQRFSEQALTYAQHAQDPNLLVAALRALGVTFDYQKRPVKALHIYQQTIPFLDQVSPLLRARIYALLAGAYAKIGQKEDAFNFLGQAYDTFPEKPQDDPCFLYADAGYFTLIIWDGAVHLENQQPKRALEIFLQAGETFSQKKEPPKRIQSELLIYKTRALIMLRNLEAASMCLMEAIKEASAVPSEIRYQQAHELFSQLQIIWPHEPCIYPLKDFFLR